MNQEDKIEFVTDLTNAVRDKIITQIQDGRLPEEWDGIELRWLLRGKFEAQVSSSVDRKRKREFNNFVLANNI